MRAEKTQLAVFFDGLAVFIDGVALRQGVAHTHDDAALDLSLAGLRIDSLADIVRGDHFLHARGLAVKDADLRRVAVGDVGDGIRHIRAELVRLGEVFSVEFPADERRHAAAVGRAERLAGAAARLAGDERLA